MARRRGVTPKQRFRIMRRDNFRCCLCGRKAAAGVELQVDHKVPFSKGGSDRDENLWTLCQPCNSGKSDLPIPSWRSGHPKPAFQVFSPDGEAMDFFTLPDDSELDEEKIKDFDRYVLSEFNIECFMRRISRFDRHDPNRVLRGDPAIAREFNREIDDGHVYAVIVGRTDSPHIRTRTFVGRPNP